MTLKAIVRNVLIFTLFLVFCIGLIRGEETSTISGTIGDDVPFHEVPISVSVDNSLITVDMQTTGGDLDTLLYLVDSNGTILAENDDRVEGDLNALIVFPQASPGDYTVIATRFGVTEGATTGEFDLVVDVRPPEVVEEAAFAVSDADLLAAGFPAIEPHDEAEWTILVYYGGDTSLEASILNDLDEFEMAGGSNERVRIIALVDRHPDFTTSNEDWNTTRLFEVAADVTGDHGVAEPATIDTPALADLGDLDTGNAQTLAQYLIWAVRQYPAKHYALALGSHGGAWRGIITDDSSAGTLIPLSKIEKAFNTVYEATGIEKFDLLINDACSMGSVEYHRAMSRYFKVSLASPEIIVEPALDMTLLVDTLNASPDIPLTDLSVGLIDAYITRDALSRQSIDSAYLTHSVTDLAQFDQVHAAVEDFAIVVNQNPLQYSTIIGQARANTYTYGAFIGEDNQIDLGHFMGQVIAFTLDPELARAARAVIRALESTRLYGNAADAVAELTTYYSIYFPQNSESFQQTYFIESDFSEWSRMLRSYYNAITPQVWAVEDSLLAYHPPIAPEVTVTRVYPAVGNWAFPPTISVEVVGRRISGGAFTIDQLQPDGSAYRLAETEILTEVVVDNTVHFINDWKSGVDQSFFNLTPLALPVVTDGSVSNNERLTFTNGVVTLEGRYRENSETEWLNVAVIFDFDGQARRVINRGNNGALASISIPPGAEFQAYRFLVRPDGQIQRLPGTVYTWPNEGLSWSQEIMETGEYDLGFLVTAFGGISGFDSVSVTIANEDVNLVSQGYSDVNLGINFQHPVGWSEIVDFGNWLYTANSQGNAAINVYYFRNLDDVFEIVNNVQNRFELQIEGMGAALHLSDEFGLTFNHSYQTDSGTVWNGRAATFHRRTAQGERGIIFSADVVADDENAPALDDLFQTMLESVRFFDAEALRADEERAWDYRFINRRIPYPVPYDWVVLTSDETWTTYRPSNDPEGATLASIARISKDYADSTAVLEGLLAQFVPNAEPEPRIYYGEYHTWEAASYTINRDGQPVTGRIYVTEINNRFYGLRFETLLDDHSVMLFRTIFEPMLDGFAPPSTITFAGGGTRTAFVKTAVVTANDICEDMAWGDICHGDGEPVRTLTGGGEAILLTEAGQQVQVDDLLAFQVGSSDDGEIDPFSVAVINLQANVPDDETDENVKLIIFGGVTVINRALLPVGELHRLEVYNLTDEVVNIRSYPSIGYVADTLNPGQVVTAVARLADTSWIRVRLPGQPDETGWVLADLVGSIDGTSENALKVGDPNRPNLGNMQSLEILMNDTVDSTALNGILIQTAPGQDTIDLEINDILFEIAGGSMFLWRGELGTIETVTASEQVDVFGDTTNQRRPSGWSSEVLSGSVRIRLGDTAAAQGGGVNAITSVAGTEVSFSGETGAFQILTTNQSGGSLGTSLSTSFEATQAYVSLSGDEILELLSNQALFNNLDLTTASVLADYFIDEEGFYGSDAFSFSEDSLFDYLFGETDVYEEEITDIPES